MSIDLNAILQAKAAKQAHQKAQAQTRPDSLTEGLGKDLDSDAASGATWALANVHKRQTDSQFIQQRLEDLRAAISQVQASDLSGVEAVLVSQISTLNTMFNHLSALAFEVQRTGAPTSQREFATLFHSAMRAQEQCRRAISTLAEMKNPKRAVFIKKQQNLAIAQQTSDKTRLRAEWEKFVLSAGLNDEPMDTSAAGNAKTDCLEVETMGEVNRPQDTRRQGQKRKK